MIELIILLLAIPVGFLIAWLARDELLSGRNWFLLLTILSLILSIIFRVDNPIFYSLMFIAISSLILYWKSFDGAWRKI